METTITATDVVKTYALGVRAATAEISRIAGGPRVLVLTTFDTDDDAFAALQAGASGFLLKNAPPADLLTAIRVVAAGDAVVAPRVTRRLLERFAGQFARAGARASPVTSPTGSAKCGSWWRRGCRTPTHVGRILAKFGAPGPGSGGRARL